MPSMKEIKRKIKSVSNTQKTTRAMKLVSQSKQKKAVQVAKRSQEYAKKIDDVLHDIAFKIEKYRTGGVDSRFFTAKEEVEREQKKVDIVFVTADKGLCGGFNAQTIKEVKRLMEVFKAKNVKVRLRGIGKKGVEYFRFQEIDLLDEVSDLSHSPTYERSSEFIKKATQDFSDGVTDKVILVHNGFKNMITQEVRTQDLLPIDTKFNTMESSLSLMEIEPEDNDEQVLEELAAKYIEYSMFYALIDSLAAEHSARAAAMDAATKNAKEMVSDLTLQYNKARQQAITTELIEINTGIEAMK